MNTGPIHLTECPRDAMQGLHNFVPTETKVRYLNALLKVGFNTLDFGSFVSPKAIPQMADTAEVLDGLHTEESNTKLLAIIANLRGAEQALAYPQIEYIGFPLSVSETFQRRNTNKSIAESLAEIAVIQNLAVNRNMHLVVYLSMAFGNPYNDPYSPELCAALTEKLDALDIKHIALSDTTGMSVPANIGPLFSHLQAQFHRVQFSAHLHTTPAYAAAKIQAALQAGCTRFEGALGGFGGCPLASDSLTGNLDTLTLISELHAAGHTLSVNASALAEAQAVAAEIFG